MNKHTPGIWQISGPSSGKASSDDGGDYAIYIRNDAGDAQIFAEVIYRTDTNTYQPVEANAKLIAAAPDLVQALILATQELNAIRARDGAPQHIDWHRGQPLQTDSCTHEWWNELTEKCLDAIEKATGSRDTLQ